MFATPVATGLAVVQMARDGRFDEICELFAPPLRQLVTAAGLRAAWGTELDRHGPVIAIGSPVNERAGSGTIVKVPVTCLHSAITVVVSVTEAGYLAGLQLAPAHAAAATLPWDPPPYADPASFDEEEVTLGSDPLAVPGTLSLPHQQRFRAAVVLLPGSGPSDRDETMGRNKPFKDLAWGLASRGVAVLRFDKVTNAHPGEVNNAANFTLTDEYVPAAVAAIDVLRQHSRVDAERIFIVGHSLGGTVAPRVAVSEPLTAGLVVLAGGTQPLHWNIVRQLRYLASLDSQSAVASERPIEVLSAQAALIDGPELTASTPSQELPFGTPASYWLDLRAYHPVAVAATLDIPILILQGGRDYQVTVEDDLEGWRKGLAGRPQVTIRVFPTDNHLFFTGSGQSAPAEYEPAQHMDPAVVNAIADWLPADGDDG